MLFVAIAFTVISQNFTPSNTQFVLLYRKTHIVKLEEKIKTQRSENALVVCEISCNHGCGYENSPLTTCRSVQLGRHTPFGIFCDMQNWFQN
jgi:hypothetical protein